MGVAFIKSSYHEAFRGDPIGGLSAYNPSKWVANSPGLQFKYGFVDSERFGKKFTNSLAEEGSLKRKVAALPFTLFALVRIVCHAVKAVFIGLPKAVFDRGQSLKLESYHIARDFQSAFGWILTLFHDRAGQFHAQESAFQKQCYDFFVLNREQKTNFRKTYPSDGTDRSKFALLHVTTVEHAMEYAWFTSEHLGLISSEQMKELPLPLLERFFPNTDEGEKHRKILAPDVQQVLKKRLEEIESL